jgi:transcriptional regulator with XRE-family HTH domain
VTRLSSPPEPPRRLLRDFREEAGLTQVQLAELSGVSQTAISLYEHGLRIPEAIARRLKFTLQQYLPTIDFREVDLSTESEGHDVTQYRMVGATS